MNAAAIIDAQKRKIAELEAALDRAAAHGEIVLRALPNPLVAKHGLEEKGASTYEIIVLDGKLPSRIDPRDNVALRLFGPKVSDALFRIFRAPAVLMWAAIVTPLAGCCAVLGISGVYSYLGWACLSVWPSTILVFAFHNVHVLRCIFYSFAFRTLMMLNVFVIGVLLDAVSFEAPRVAAILSLALALFMGLVGDARRPVKHSHGILLSVNHVALSVCGWALIILFCEALQYDILNLRRHAQTLGNGKAYGALSL